MDGSGAKRLGERLLKEVEVEGLSELLSSLRDLAFPQSQRSVFGIPELDALLPQPPAPAPVPTHQPQPAQQQSDDDLWDPDPAQVQQPHAQPPQLAIQKADKKNTNPIIELISPPLPHHPSPAGKTSLIYLTTTLAILPTSLSSVPLNGKDAAVILLDPLSHFSVPRLAEVMLTYITTAFKSASKDPTNDSSPKQEITSCVKRSLVHVHVFRPASWDSLLATLRNLPDYLFDKSRHRSMNRAVHSIVLEDIDAFAFHVRNAFTSTTTASATPNPLTTASTHLTTQLSKISSLLSCAIILTSHSTTPSAFRPAVPTSWPQTMQVTRLAVRRVEVLKFMPEISIEEAEAERHQRWEVVARRRFEAWKVIPGKKDGEGFVFRVGRGVEVEREEER